MNLFGYPAPNNSQRAIWNSIYSQSEQLRVPRSFNMQSSRSHANLQDLPAGFENLNLDSRTATSTPASRAKTDSSLSRTSLLTPPADASLADPFLSSQAFKRPANTDRNMHLESRADDDVFIGAAKAQVDAEAQVDAKAQVDNNAQSPATSREVVGYTSPNTKPTPRSDRLTDPITPQNAQGVLPPEACIFVAKYVKKEPGKDLLLTSSSLSVSRTDEQLEKSVHDAFDQFGNCIVKVRRDRHGHPFALVQYHTIDAATQAIEGGRDLIVDDRKIRTEHAEARREYILQNADTGLSIGSGSVVLSRVGGGPVSKDEAHELLSRYGPIQETQPTTHADANTYGMPEGIWVKFAYYLDFKDALKAFNSTTTMHKIMEPPNLEPRTRLGPVVVSSPRGQGHRTPRSTTDQKSIFVGNLPHDVTEAELLEIFSTFGHIKGCNVIRKPITGGQGYNIFGFVEYSCATESERAAETEIDIRGQRIRVEPKEYSARRHTRLQHFGHPPSSERPQRGIAWPPSSGAYQPPPAAMPYGFQPIYFQQPAFHPGYAYATTPPSSGQRQRAQTGDGYIHGGSPHASQHYLPVGRPAYATMAQYQDAEPEDYPPPSRPCR
ncbi:hypothetical protein LTR70_008344 [Exophiala xenobiotica]|uniref:RRM domain-containing protein n=1 Tax=Lithohypha guttulata TaxID=1690604 RepID=A0ABR0JY96_9EURO|nr:hypothetical protein LTR24_009001 [Lithohypha guttulata]KAK5312164.1 hypothetical protein LTR70_008344 [Exophiala xenobiotica]